MTKLILKGESGQGVQLLGFVLGHVLKDEGYQMAMSSSYGALVRKGKSQVDLVFSKEKIESPLVERADLKYDLSSGKWSVAPINMFVLGLIFKKLNLRLDQEQLRKYLPKKFQKENLLAIKSGYEI